MNKGKNLNSMAYYFFMYVPYGAVCPLLAQYLSSIGFSGTEVGIVVAAGTCGAAVGNLFLGRVFANTRKKRLFLVTALGISGLGAVFMLSVKAFIPFVFIYFSTYLFQEPAHGLSDSVMVQIPEKNFPVIRAFGAIGFAAASFFGGALAETRGLKIIFYIHMTAYVVSAILMFFETDPPDFREEKRRAKLSELAENRKFLKLLLCSFFVLGSVMGNNTYFGYLFREAGGSVKGIGLAFFLMCLAEALVMSMLYRVKRHISTEKLMIVGIGTAILRFGLYAMGPSVGVLLGTFLLQGIMDGIILVEIVNYFCAIVEPRLASLAVSVYYALGNNLSAIITNLLSGMILDASNARMVFLFFTLSNAVGLALYMIMGLHKENK